MAEAVAAPGEATNLLAAPWVSGRILGEGYRLKTTKNTTRRTTAESIFPRPVAHPPAAVHSAPQSTRPGKWPYFRLAVQMAIRTWGLEAGRLCPRPLEAVRESTRSWPILGRLALTT